MSFTLADKLNKTKLQVHNTHPFFAFIMLNMRMHQKTKEQGFETMGVDCKGNLYYNDEFVNKVFNPNSQMNSLAFVLCHEVLHVVLQCMARKGNRDMGIWNVAQDLVINYMLTKENIPQFKECLLPDTNGDFSFPDGMKINVDGKTTEEVYNELYKKAKKVRVSLKIQADGSYKGGFDKHMDPKNSGMTPDEQKMEEQRWKGVIVTAKNAAKACGTMSGTLERMLDKLFDPEVDWRSLLRQFVTKDLPADFSFRTPSKRSIATGIYYPSIIRENVEVMVAIDVSGSIGEKDYTKFMSELFGMINGFDQISVRVIWWAMDVKDEDDIMVRKGEESKLSYTPKNSGGTKISCVKEYIEEKNYRPKVMVYLTDGYVEQEADLVYPSICVISTNGSDEVLKDKATRIAKMVNEYE